MSVRWIAHHRRYRRHRHRRPADRDGRPLLAVPQAHAARGHGVNAAADTNLPDTASGFRAYARASLLRLNIVTDLSYAMETIIQAGHKRLRIATVPMETKAPTRPSRLSRNAIDHMARSGSAIVRSHVMFKPYVVFATLAAVFGVLALVPMVRFLVLWIARDGKAGNVGVISDLQRTNRALIEDEVERIKEIQYRR